MPAMRASAASRWSWAPQPPDCVCQPQNALPSYSIPNAILMDSWRKSRAPEGARPQTNNRALCRRRGSILARNRSPQAVEQPLGPFLLIAVAFLHCFLQGIGRPRFFAHLLVRLGEIEL